MTSELNSSYLLSKLSKTFPGVLAVKNVDLNVRRGEIHGVIGKNGAGKSVMMSMIAGIQKPTSGQIFIGGKPVDAHTYSPARAHELGVVLIPQEPVFAPYMSVVDNIYIGIPMKNRFGFLDHRTMEQKVNEIAERLSIHVHPNDRMGMLRLEDQQLLAFGKAMFVSQAKVILLDEITASLPRERKILLLNFLRKAIQEDPEVSFTLITHHINEVIEFCDRVTVLRDGEAVATLNVAETSSNELADLVVGEIAGNNGHESSVHQASVKQFQDEGNPLLSLDSLSKKGKYSNVSFALKKGQVIGLAGLDGSGKHELLETLTGLMDYDSGMVCVEGNEVRVHTPVDALKKGIAYLPRKREEQAIIHNRSVQENILISIYQRICNRLGVINWAKSNEIATNGVKALNVKTPSLSTNIDYLSGGNRQKVVLNRIDNTQPKIYILNEPTRGVDLATKPEILRTIRNRFTVNSGVIFTSESEEELVEGSDLILVFYKGEVRKSFIRNHPDFNVAEVYKAVQGVGVE